jgi:hypothetical protein
VRRWFQEDCKPETHYKLLQTKAVWTDIGASSITIESLVGSAFDLLQYLAFPVSLTSLKCVALLALKRHPPFTNTVRYLILLKD